MADTYISNGEAHITIGSEDWKSYCEFLETKLTALEEQRMKLDDRIREIHAILHPPVIVDVADEEEPNTVVPVEAGNKEKDNSIRPEEKYLLVEDIAKRYNVTIESVRSACDNGKIPCHGKIGNWRFTGSDVEQLTSVVARNSNIFSSSQRPTGAVYSVNAKPPKGKIGTAEVCKILGVSNTEIALLRRKEILVGQTVNNVPLGRGIALFYDIGEVNALKDMIQADGGKDAFLAKLREREGAKAV